MEEEKIQAAAQALPSIAFRSEVPATLTYLPIGPQALSKFLVLPNQTETSHQAEQAP